MYFDVLNVESDEAPVIPTGPRAGMPSVPVRAKPTTRPLDQAAITGIAMAVTNAPSYSDNWVNLADVGSILSKISPDLHARNYGYERLRDFAEASGIVDLSRKNMGDKPPIALVRLK